MAHEPVPLNVIQRQLGPTLKQAPRWNALGIASSSVQQKSYIEITRDQYRLAWEAIVAKTKP